MKRYVTLICYAIISAVMIFFTACNGGRENEKTDLDSSNVSGAGTEITARNAVQAKGGARHSTAPGAIAYSTSRGLSPVRTEERKTTEPTVLVSGTVTYDNGTPITSATVELWHDGLTLMGHQNNSVRLAASDLDKAGRYSVAGSDGTGLRIEVQGVSRAIADLQSAPDQTTYPRVRRLTQDFMIPIPNPVYGIVLDSRDVPVSGALVSLRSEDVVTDGWYYGNQQTTTTAAGEFTLAAVAKGNTEIGAVAAGYAPATLKISVPTSAPVALRLTKGSATIAGHVLLFPDDKPAAGAHISSVRVGKEVETLGLAAGSAVNAVVAADGTFKLENLSAGRTMINLVDSHGKQLHAAPHERKDMLLLNLSDMESTAITLRVFPGYTISGVVYDKDTSEPLSGAKVHTKIDTKSVRPVESGHDGRYVLANVPPAEQISLTATYPGYLISDLSAARDHMSGSQWVSIKTPDDSANAGQDLSMTAVVHVGGRVENEQGLPVAGAQVEMEGSVDQSDKMAVTDADGHFTLEASPFQKGIFEVSAKGYAHHHVEEQLQVSNEDVTDLIIVMKEEAIVEGVVVNPEGQAVSLARVSITDDPYQLGESFVMSRSRYVGSSLYDGSFKIEGLPGGKTTLSAAAEGYSNGSRSVELMEGEHKSGVQIKLLEELNIQGRVVEKDDEPVLAQVIPIFGGKPTITDSNGYFKLTGVQQGETNILAIVIGTNEKKSVSAKAGVKDLVIRMDEGLIMVKGKVVDLITKRPVENFKVELRDGSTTPQTDGEGPGGFRFTMTPKTSDRAVISADGYKTKTYSVEPSEGVKVHEQTFELGIGAGVSGRVVSAGSGKPVPNLPITAHELIAYSETPDGSTIADSEGKFVISNLPSGKTKVVAVPSPPMAWVQKTINLVDGQVTDIGDIEVGGGGGDGVAGTAFSETGSTVPR